MTCATPGCDRGRAPGRKHCDECPPGRKVRAPSPESNGDKPRWTDKQPAPPRVARIERELRMMRRLLAAMLDDHGHCDLYRWAENIGYGPVSIDSERSAKGTGDATGNAVAGSLQGLVRADMRKAWVATTAARRNLAEACEALKHAAGRDMGSSDLADGPALISPAELSRARKAQKRREARGEGWGES